MLKDLRRDLERAQAAKTAAASRAAASSFDDDLRGPGPPVNTKRRDQAALAACKPAGA
jgi:hypothetical protein